MRYSFGISAAALSLVSFATPGSAFFRVPCPGRIVAERADPIVSPGSVSGHVHTISGGNGFDFSMTYEQARQSTCSSCPIKEDLSNYWTPQLYYQAENGTFQYVPQSGDGPGNYGGMTVYYLQRGGPNNDNLTAFPEGFRMLAGDPFKRAPTDDFAGQAISYVCLDYSGVSSQYNHLPNKTCPDGVRAQVFFPSCWDGVNLDSADHKSHMAYPTKYSYDNGPCPASHPVHMISIFYEVIYSTAGFEWWNGTTQPFVFAMGDPLGYGFHGDFVNGWNVSVLQNATDRCTNLSGLISDCDVFADNLFTTAESEACIIAPQVDEQVTGTLDALPGCNPVTWGPSEAPYSYANCPVANISAPKTYYTNVTGWDYIGCGADDVSVRTFNGSSFSSNTLTVESCLAYCKTRGYHYAGLEYASECYCGNTLPADRAPVPGVLGNCIEPCAGNSSEYCGGSSRLSMYYTVNVTATTSCPSGNMTSYTNPNGTTFQVMCGFDIPSSSNIGMKYSTNGIQGCIDMCGATAGCQSVAMSGQACYMKSTVGTAKLSSGVMAAQLLSAKSSSSSSSSTVSSTSSTASASKSASSTSTGSSSSSSATVSGTSSVSSSSSASASKSSSATISSTITSSSSSKTLSSTSSSTSSSSSKTSSSSTSSASASATPLCPNLNATIYTEPITGYNFTIECGIDHASGDMSNNLVYVKDLAGCISACANRTGCVDVSLSGTACYLKQKLGAPVYSNKSILGARLMISSSSSSASATATATVQQNVAKVSSSSSSVKTTSSSSSIKTSTTSTAKASSSSSAAKATATSK